MAREAGDLILVGRERDIAGLHPILEKVKQEGARLVLLAGEAGAGKSRLAREVAARAVRDGWRVMSGKCLHGGLTPYMPISEALRDGGLENLMEFSRPPRVEHALFIYYDGRLCAKASRKEGALDSELFAGMLTAVEAFVKDSLAGMMGGVQAAEGFNVFGQGQYKVLIASRPHGSLALVLAGQETELLKDEMAETLDRIERYHGGILRNWDGGQGSMAPVRADLERFLTSGKYDGVDEVTEPENRHWRLLANVTRGVSRAARDAPLLLFLDDMHWADPSSLGLVRHLLKRLKGERFVVLGTYRPEDAPPDHPLTHLRNELESEGLVTQVTVGALAGDDIRRMVEQELGEDLARGALGNLIVRESGGNPLLSRELVAVLKEEQAAVRDGGQWKLTRKVDKLKIPGKVSDAVMARLQGLSRDEREVLETGAVMGEAFRPRPVACVLEANFLQVHRALREIERRHRLIQSIEGGDGYRFNHPLTREVLYENMPTEMRAEYHRLAVDCLVKEGGDSITHLAEVAYHAGAGKHKDAVGHLKAAGDAAKDEYQNAEAGKFYASALEAAVDDEERSALLEALGDTCFQAGEINGAADHWRKARSATRNRDRRIFLTANLAYALANQGKLTEAASVLEADRPGEQTGDMAAARWLVTRAEIRAYSWEMDAVREDADAALAIYERSGGKAEDIAGCYTILGVTDNWPGSNARAEVYLKKGLAVAEAGKLLVELARIVYLLADIENDRGNQSEAMRFIERSIQICERTNDRFRLVVDLSFKGDLQTRLGRIDEANFTLGYALKLSEEIGIPFLTGLCRRRLVPCLLEMGLMEKAEDEARRALDGAKGISNYLPDAVDALAEVLIARGNPEEAICIGRRLMDDFQQHYSKKIVSGYALRILAHAFSAQGRRDEAKKAFAEAIGEYGNLLSAWQNATTLRRWGEALASWGEEDEAMKKLEAAKERFTAMGAELELRKTDEDIARLKSGGAA